MYGLLTNRPESVTTITEIKMITDYEAELSVQLVGHIEPPCRLARAAAALTLNDYRLKPVGSGATESRGARLKPSEAVPAESRLKARWAR